MAAAADALRLRHIQLDVIMSASFLLGYYAVSPAGSAGNGTMRVRLISFPVETRISDLRDDVAVFFIASGGIGGILLLLGHGK